MQEATGNTFRKGDSVVVSWPAGDGVGGFDERATVFSVSTPVVPGEGVSVRLHLADDTFCHAPASALRKVAQ